MNKRKGFTLIELLAVIVILAVIALIATPIIMNVINDSKKGAAKDSAYAIIKAAELEIAKAEFQAPALYNEDDNLNYKGTKPSKMALEIDTNGKINLAAYIDGYCVVKGYSDTEVSVDDTKKTEDACVNGARSNINVDIKDGMIPVTYNASGNTIKADTRSSWYDYDSKKWANAVVVTSESRDKYLSAVANTVIAESDILGYYVYIPRYKYQLWNVNNEGKTEQEIKIEFERRSQTKSNGTQNGEWLTHPAFTFGSRELNGIWVGKFEMTGTSANPTIKPNQRSLTQTISSDQNNLGTFKTIKSMQSESYGLSSYDSHMMKNIEWGAVAYLTQSKYGRCTSETCTQVWMNNVNTGYGSETAISGQPQWGPSITGCSGISANAGVKSNMTACESGRDYKQAGVNASTTGNITGVYDMSGGTLDRIMGVLVDENGNPIYGSSGFNTSNMPEEKYYDKYVIPTGDTDFSKGKLGDATRETIKVLNSVSGGWYIDYSYMPVVSHPWFSRGGFVLSGQNVGTFNFDRYLGFAGAYSGSRAVVVSE